MYLLICLFFLTFFPEEGLIMYNMQSIIADFDIKGFNNIYYFEFDKNFTHTPEKHDFWEIVYLESGEAIVKADGREHILLAGEAYFHNPG